MKRMSLLLAAISLTSAAGCASLQRSSASGYSDRYETPNYSRDKRRADKQASMAELGLFDESDLSNDDSEAIRMRTRLRKSEMALEGKRERDQYYKNKPYFRNDDERMEFLALDSFETRARWLNARGIQGPMTAHRPEIQGLIDINDIAVGMTKQAVRDSWGEPEQVEVAGNPLYSNERWHYKEQRSSADGYQSENRYVYFESGRVVGWETR